MNVEIGQKREQLANLCRRHHVRRLALFGSALRDDFDPQHSDLDFLVEFDPLPPGTYAAIYLALSAALEHLFTRPIDLIEHGAIRNPFILREIEAHQETVYAA